MAVHYEGIDAVLRNLKNIKELNGTVRDVGIYIKSNGLDKSEDPAYYGSLHNENNFPFTEPTLRDFTKKAMNDDRVREYFRDMLRIKKKRRSSKSMDEAAILMGKIAAEEVLMYILYDMPQKPQPWKVSGERNLIETGELLDSIFAKVEHKGREIWRGY